MEDVYLLLNCHFNWTVVKHVQTSETVWLCKGLH
jgi:hypothetical protein